MKNSFFFLFLLLANAGAAPIIVLSGQTGEPSIPYVDISDDDMASASDSPSAVNSTNLGMVRIGTFREKLFRVRNDGDELLKITRAEAPADDFTILGLIDRELEPGDFVEFRVRFNPSSTDKQTVRLEFDSNSLPVSSGTYSFRVSGTGSDDDADLEVFGQAHNAVLPVTNGDLTPSEDEGTLSTRAFQADSNPMFVYFDLVNHGNTPMVLSDPVLTGLNPEHFSIFDFPDGEQIVPGSEAVLILRFDPLAEGNFRTRVRFDTNDFTPGREKFEFTVEVRTVRAGKLRVAGPSFDWGNEQLGSAGSTGEYYIENTAIAPLEIISFEVLAGATGTQEWFVAGPGTGIIERQESRTFALQARIRTPGVVLSYVKIRYREFADGPEKEYLQTVSAFGVGGFLSVFGNGREIKNGDFSPSELDWTDFGTVESGISPNASRTYLLRNTGNRSLTIRPLNGALPYLFYVDGASVQVFDIDLAAGEAIPLQVVFFEPDRGVRRVDVEIVTFKGQVENTHTFRIVARSYTAGEPLLSIYGKNPPVEIPIATRPGDPDDGRDFGNVLVGATGVQRFTVRNLGDAPLVLNSDPIVVTNRFSKFSIQGQAFYDSDTPIPPGEERYFFVYFKSTVAGDFSDMIRVSTNDPSRPTYTFEVTGTAVEEVPLPITIRGGADLVFVVDTGPTAVPSPPAGTDFGTHTTEDFILARTFEITNDSDAPISIGEIAGIGSDFFTASGFSTDPIPAGETTIFFMSPTPEDPVPGTYESKMAVSPPAGSDFGSVEFPVSVVYVQGAMPPTITGIRRSGGDYVLDVEPNGSEYTVEYGADVQSWSALTSLGTLTGNVVLVPASLAPGEEGFFRLRVE